MLKNHNSQYPRASTTSAYIPTMFKLLSKCKRLNKTSDTPFTRKRVKITPKEWNFTPKKSKIHSKKVFHYKKSENQSLFTPTQKRVLPNPTLSWVKILLCHSWKSDFHSWKSDFYNIWKALGTKFLHSIDLVAWTYLVLQKLYSQFLPVVSPRDFY